VTAALANVQLAMRKSWLRQIEPRSLQRRPLLFVQIHLKSWAGGVLSASKREGHNVHVRRCYAQSRQRASSHACAATGRPFFGNLHQVYDGLDACISVEERGTFMVQGAILSPLNDHDDVNKMANDLFQRIYMRMHPRHFFAFF